MPELPEVERAVRLLNEIGSGKTIIQVETTEDNIVYSNITHNEFAKALTGRKMIAARRYGKVFYLELEGSGQHPVLHFGMTGMLHVKGRLADHYREAPSKDSESEWPPRWTKFILHFADSAHEESTQVAFRDARRLGRIRLCNVPLDESPISDLGFDPLISMPLFPAFSGLVYKRKGATIKALLLDQSFSAGVGNWVADEILYHARIHPEQRCNTLSEEQLATLHDKIIYVCKTATDVNADDKQFPDDWLFKYRWNKGKKKKNTTEDDALQLPSGQPATIKWVTVGGRTSAYVCELQTLVNPSPKQTDTDGALEMQKEGSTGRSRKRKNEETVYEQQQVSAKPPRKTSRQSDQIHSRAKIQKQ